MEGGRRMKYYKTYADNGSLYEYHVEGNRVSIATNGNYWGCPQGERFIRALLNDIDKLEEMKTVNCLTISEKIGIWKMGRTSEHEGTLSHDSFLALKNIWLDSSEEEREELYEVSCVLVDKVKNYLAEQDKFLNAEECE
jgi:hypothetical protein